MLWENNMGQRRNESAGWGREDFNFSKVNKE